MHHTVVSKSWLRRANSPRGFQFAMILATVVPITVLLVQHGWTMASGAPVGLLAGLAVALGFLGTAHVPSTLYLFSDTKVRQFMRATPGQLIAIPLLIVLLSTVAFAAVPLQHVMFVALFYVLWQAWHYGKQNVGVFAFSCMMERRPSMDAAERFTIVGGVVAGVLGTYQVLRPAFGLDARLFVFDTSVLDTVGLWAYRAGAALYVVVLLVMLRNLVAHRSRYTPLNATLYMLTVAFFGPMYLSTDPVFAFTSYAVAHGLQYLGFLGYHAAGRTLREEPYRNLGHESASQSFRSFVNVMPLALFAVIVLLGGAFWYFGGTIVIGRVINLFSQPLFQTGFDDMMLVRIMLGGLFGLTMAHFWFDQRLWRLREPAKRDWLRQAYAEVLPRQAARPAA
jgi:hypothetical protein